MTNKDSHIIFKVVLDKNAEGIAYGGCPAFLDEEVDLFLNEIEKLIATDVNLHAVHTDYNEYALEDVHDEDNRMTILSVLLKYGQFQTNCVLTSHEVVKPFKQTYNNIPWVENPVATLENDKLLVYVDPVLMQDPMYAPRVEDNTEFYRVDLTYVKKPTKFDYTKPEQELDFPEDVMYEIINRAVVIALENTIF